MGIATDRAVDVARCRVVELINSYANPRKPNKLEKILIAVEGGKERNFLQGSIMWSKSRQVVAQRTSTIVVEAIIKIV